MKFDMNQAWNDAVGLIKGNTEVLGIVAGVFFFLPSLALSVLAPGTELEAAAGNPARMQEAFASYFSNAWWVFLLYFLFTVVGTLAVYALYGRRPKPTVGEAISIGFRGFLPYLAASLLVGFLIGIGIVIAGALSAAVPFLGIIIGLIVAALAIIVSIRIILVGPIIAIDGESNPVTAIKRSWALVKGNTRRVFLFLFLLVVAMLVVSIILGLIFAAIGAATGPTVGLWVEGILGGIMGAAFTIVMLAVYTAIHKQLAGEVSKADLETFS